MSAGAAEAIVVLSAGRHYDAPEAGGRDIVGPLTLERLRYGAQLHRATGLPVLMTGGAPEDGERAPLAELMRRSFEQDFGLPVAWTEAESTNTAENAFLSAAILLPLGIDRVYVVTHAWHMPRARFIFEQAGFTVVPAGTAHMRPLTVLDLYHFLPQANGLQASYYAMHELLGLAWYHLRYGE